MLGLIMAIGGNAGGRWKIEDGERVLRSLSPCSSLGFRRRRPQKRGQPPRRGGVRGRRGEGRHMCKGREGRFLKCSTERAWWRGHLVATAVTRGEGKPTTQDRLHSPRQTVGGTVTGAGMIF